MSVIIIGGGKAAATILEMELLRYEGKLSLADETAYQELKQQLVALHEKVSAS